MIRTLRAACAALLIPAGAALAVLPPALVTAPSVAEAQPRHCPPGLANRAVPCVPPGQVGRSAAPVIVIGQPLPRDARYVVIEDWRRYGLSRPARGTDYVRIDNDIYRVVRGTNEVLAALGRLAR